MTNIETIVYIKEPLENQIEVFRFLAEKAVEHGFATEKEAVFQALTSREQEGTTGMMDGFAIPHGKHETFNQPAIVIVTLPRGVEWESMDGQPIDFVLSMMIPEAEKGEGHLKILSQVARMLMKEKVKTELKEAGSSDEVKKILDEQITI